MHFHYILNPPRKWRDRQSLLTRMKSVDIHVLFSPFLYCKLQNKYFLNSKDQDEMIHDAAFHQVYTVY